MDVSMDKNNSFDERVNLNIHPTLLYTTKVWTIFIYKVG